MQVPASGLYTFTVNANDGFRLTLNQVLILDQLTTVEDETAGHNYYIDNIQLKNGTYIPLKFEYYENTDQAFVTLKYRLTS